jgi:hypothetical protein
MKELDLTPKMDDVVIAVRAMQYFESFFEKNFNTQGVLFSERISEMEGKLPSDLITLLRELNYQRNKIVHHKQLLLSRIGFIKDCESALEQLKQYVDSQPKEEVEIPKEEVEIIIEEPSTEEETQKEETLVLYIVDVKFDKLLDYIDNKRKEYNDKGKIKVKLTETEAKILIERISFTG